MTGDVWTTLRIMNCTSLALVGYPDSFSAYQMAYWFAPAEGNTGTLPLSSQASKVFPLQFLNGVGEQDDIANLVISVQKPGQAPTTANQIVWLQARSLKTGVHSLQATVLNCQVSAGPFVIGAMTKDGDWTLGYKNVRWYNCSTFDQQTFPLSLYPPPLLPGWLQSPNQVIAIVDLSQLYPVAATATSIATAITTNSLQPIQAEDLWTKVTSYTNLG